MTWPMVPAIGAVNVEADRFACAAVRACSADTMAAWSLANLASRAVWVTSADTDDPAEVPAFVGAEPAGEALVPVFVELVPVVAPFEGLPALPEVVAEVASSCWAASRAVTKLCSCD